VSILPALTPITHMVWRPDGGKDTHGNPTGTYSAPIPRMIISWFPLARRLWQIDPTSINAPSRTDTDIHMLVPTADLLLYNKLDRVIVNGLTYQVQGVPMDWSQALPFANTSYSMFVDGEVHCRRTTATGVLAGQ